MLKIDGKDKSTVPGVDRNVLHQLKVPFIPSVSCQKEIVHILELLDKKIENNMQINDNLFAMSRAIYLHSFFGKKENTKISDVLLENKKSSIQVSEAKDSQGNYYYPNLRTIHLVEARLVQAPRHFRVLMEGNVKSFKKFN